jgi:hypothetical protein
LSTWRRCHVRLSPLTFQAWRESHLDPHITDDDLALDFSTLFDAYDKNHDGEINLVEFLSGITFLSEGSLEDKANCMQFIFPF